MISVMAALNWSLASAEMASVSSVMKFSSTQPARWAESAATETAEA
jgi:hypothetical protein